MSTEIPGGAMRPASPAPLTREQVKEREDLRRKLLEAIFQDPEIKNVTNVSVVIDDTKGSMTVHLLGKVPTGRGRERAAEIVRNNVPRDAVVVNEIGVA
jgi:hypothetical protein